MNIDRLGWRVAGMISGYTVHAGVHANDICGRYAPGEDYYPMLGPRGYRGSFAASSELTWLARTRGRRT